MSFSSEVKSELVKHMPAGRRQAEAELCAIFEFSGGEITPENVQNADFSEESPEPVKKCFTILKKSYNIELGAVYSGNYAPKKEDECQAYLRGAFICCGSVNDPAKSYHLEFFAKEHGAEKIRAALETLGMGAGISKRKNGFTVYIKDGALISDLLAEMGASLGMLNFENVRAMNETRGMINRRVNCEIGNLRKSTEAGMRQIEAINHIEKVQGIDSLPEVLQETARLRIEHPEASLQELGEMMNPPMGRSGVNHRLQKLISIADNL